MILNIMKKEIKELLTRSTIISLVIVSFVMGSMGKFASTLELGAEKKALLSIADLDSTDISAKYADMLSEISEIVYRGGSPSEAELAARDKNAGAVIVLNKGFKESAEKGDPAKVEIIWLLKGAGIMDIVSASPVENALKKAGYSLVEYLLQKKGLEGSKNIISPVYSENTVLMKDKRIENMTPEMIAAALNGQSNFVPVIIMMLIIMSGSIIIASMGQEKENKTLETLLTMPVKRSDIVMGKIFGGAIVGLITAGIYMVGFSYYIRGFTGSIQSISSASLALGAADYALVGLSIFTSLLCGLALCLLLGLFAKDYRAAQTLTMPVAMLAMIPMIMTMFKDFDTLSAPLRVFLFAIPFSHPMMAMRLLMFDNYRMVAWGIVYSLLFFTLLITVVVRVFNTDYMITGRGLDKFMRNRRSI